MTDVRQQMEAQHTQRIVERPQTLDVYKLILFGSQAWGEVRPDSDIDLLVVLDDETMPQNATEKGELHRRIARRLREVEREVPIGLIVHTRPMHRRFVERDGMFARKMINQGTVLYEKGD